MQRACENCGRDNVENATACRVCDYPLGMTDAQWDAYEAERRERRREIRTTAHGRVEVGK
mgnify:CR=1 FL=1